MNNIDGVNARSIFARFGSMDLLIPYNPHGKQLKDALKKADAEVKDIKTYLLADHCSALFFSSKAGIHR